MRRLSQMIVLAFLAAGAFHSSPALGQFFFMENQDIGKPAKDFMLPLSNGQKFSLTEYRDGKKAVVFFWATWCPHCREALTQLNRSREEIENKNIKIVLVDIGEKPQVVNSFMEKNKISMDVFIDEDSAVANAYELVGVPTFYFISEKGVVADVTHSLPKNLEKVFSKT